jgi:GMP synthase (glutamine-hydrolysing)
VTTDISESRTLYLVRNEVDTSCDFHCDALAARFPTAEEIDFVAGERVPLDEAAGIVLTGSTAAVYETESNPWIADMETLVEEAVEREIPTLGVCFGHQVVNTALGGTVEHIGEVATLVDVTLGDDPLFAGVDSVVAALHSDAVVDSGDSLEPIASAPHARVFATRHRSAPLWTVQFHPEFTSAHRAQLVEDFGWEEQRHSFEDVNTGRLLENFRTLLTRATT